MTDDDNQPPDGRDEIAVLARRARERAAEAASADDIRNLADRAIDQINMLADKAAIQAHQVNELLRRLNELQGQGP